MSSPKEPSGLGRQLERPRSQRTIRFVDAVNAAAASKDIPKVKALLTEWLWTPEVLSPDDQANAPWKAYAAAIHNESYHYSKPQLMYLGLNVLDNLIPNAVISVSVAHWFIPLRGHPWKPGVKDPERAQLILCFFLYFDKEREFLLDKGADPNVPHGNGHTALDKVAGINWPGFEPLKILKNLVEHGGQPARSSALPIAAEAPRKSSSETIAIMAYLLEHGAPINAREMDWCLGDQQTSKSEPVRNTALHYAVRNRDEQTVTFLLEKGADPWVQNSHGRTPIEVKSWIDSPDRLIIDAKLRAAMGDHGLVPVSNDTEPEMMPVLNDYDTDSTIK